MGTKHGAHGGETGGDEHCVVTTVTARSADEWEAAVSGSFVPLRVNRVDADFDGSISHRSLSAGMSVSRVRSGSSGLERTERAAKTDGVPSVLFVSHLFGTAQVSQSDRQCEQRAGQSVLYVTHRPYELRFPSTIDEIVFQIPIAEIGVQGSRIEQLSARSFDSSTPFRMLQSYLTDLVDGDFSAADAQYARIGGELLSLALGSIIGDTSSLSPDTTLVTMRQFIRAHCGNPSLDPAAVAAAFHVSRRQLYNMFQLAGHSPAEAIRRARIDRACTLLRNDPERAVTQIAFEAGFADATTFSRVFSSTHGVTATQWRRGDRAA